MRPHPFAAALALCAAPALASNVDTPRATPVAAAACPMGYAQFEHLVPHLDMAKCPSGIAAENRFCRLAVSAEQAIVFVFDYDTDCLVASRVWAEDAFAVTLD